MATAKEEGMITTEHAVIAKLPGEVDRASVALRIAFQEHFPAHAEEWLTVQAKWAGRYSYRADSDLEKCRICAAFGTAIRGLEEPAEED